MRIANILVVAAVAIAPVAEGAATGDKTHALDAAPAKQRIWWDTTWNDPYVADIADADTYLRRKFRQDVTDPTTGVGADALKDMLSDMLSDAGGPCTEKNILNTLLSLRGNAVPP